MANVDRVKKWQEAAKARGLKRLSLDVPEVYAPRMRNLAADLRGGGVWPGDAVPVPEPIPVPCPGPVEVREVRVEVPVPGPVEVRQVAFVPPEMAAELGKLRADAGANGQAIRQLTEANRKLTAELAYLRQKWLIRVLKW